MNNTLKKKISLFIITSYDNSNKWITPGAPWHQWTNLSLDEFSREDGKFPDGNCKLNILSILGLTNSSICSLERYSCAYEYKTEYIN